MNLRSTVRLAGPSIALLCLAACSSVDSGPPPITDAARRYTPSSPCGPDITVPQIVSTAPAVFADPVWEARPRFQVRLRFRIDERGAPELLRATASDFQGAAEPLEEAASAALKQYRFCLPAAFSTQSDWTAVLLFRYVRLDSETGHGEMFVQQFLPSYTRAELADRRAGRVVVKGSFGSDGRPSTLAVTSSSGDGVLDHKSLEAMASLQMVFRPGTVLHRDVVFEQPYQYEIR